MKRRSGWDLGNRAIALGSSHGGSGLWEAGRLEGVEDPGVAEIEVADLGWVRLGRVHASEGVVDEGEGD
ncbi:MAG: hypothetical protein OXM88_08620, partial [bacterium]|nr:hypothetical protein [bacterium]